MVELQPPRDSDEASLRRWNAIRNEVSLPRASSVPLHAQISQLLVDLIETGHLVDGEKLPPERYLAQLFAVSLAPVRQAILDLVSKGLVVRSRGVGTFVRTPGLEEKISVLASWTESSRGQGVEVATRVVREERILTPPQIARALNIGKGECILLERLALLGREPVALLESYLSARAYPLLLQAPIGSQSLYELLEKKYGTLVTWAESVIDLSRCSSIEAEKLGVSVGEPLLRHEGTAFAEPKRPVEYFRVLYRANRVRFHLESRRSTDGVVQLLARDDHDGIRVGSTTGRGHGAPR